MLFLENYSNLQDDNWNVYESYLAAYCPNIPDPNNNGPRPGPGDEGIKIDYLLKCIIVDN